MRIRRAALPAGSREARFRAALAALVVAASAGCADPSSSPSVAVRDSAGVRIVEHGALDGIPVRGVVEPADLTIGSALGDPTQQLDRVLAGLVLSDGRVALLNGGSAEILFYDARGTLVASQGRRGEGPEDYAFPSALYPLPGDSLLVWDAGRRRATVLTAAGAFARALTLGGDLNAPLVAGVLRGGELLVVDRVPAGPPTSALLQERTHEYLYTRDGMRAADLGERPGRRMMLMQGGVPLSGEIDLSGAIDLVGAPLGASPQRAAAEGYWLGTQEAREIVLLDRTGAHRTIVRWQGPPLAVEEADRNAWLDEWIAGTANDELRTARRRAGIAAIPFPATLPAHGALVPATDGSLWIADVPRPGRARLERWTVAAPDGTFRERVELPRGAALLWASPERVLLRLEDDLGVQRVELRRLDAAR